MFFLCVVFYVSLFMYLTNKKNKTALDSHVCIVAYGDNLWLQFQSISLSTFVVNRPIALIVDTCPRFEVGNM